MVDKQTNDDDPEIRAADAALTEFGIRRTKPWTTDDQVLRVTGVLHRIPVSIALLKASISTTENTWMSVYTNSGRREILLGYWRAESGWEVRLL